MENAVMEDRVSRTTRLLFFALLLATLTFVGFSYQCLRPLTSGQIVEFETAGTIASAKTIIDRWQAGDGILFRKAIQSIHLDYFFIVLYTALLCVTCRIVAIKSKQPVFRNASIVVIVLLIGAAICDLIENMAMTHTLTQSVDRWSVRLAYDMAVAKFAVIILAILFILISTSFWIFDRKGKSGYQN